MTTNTRTLDTTPDKVWDVLADGWLYPLWVVGASRIRDVDEHWPEVGSKIPPSVGTWPLLIDDDSEVLEVRPHEMLRLRARGWPVGEAEVVITLAPLGSRTEVTIEEDVVSGPGLLMPHPLRGMTIKWRNVETLRRLAYVAERRPGS